MPIVNSAMLKKRGMALRLEDDTYERLRAAAYHLRMSQQAILHEALLLWLAKPKKRRAKV